MVNVAQLLPGSLSWERREHYPGETAAIWRRGAPYYRDRGQQRSGRFVQSPVGGSQPESDKGVEVKRLD